RTRKRARPRATTPPALTCRRNYPARPSHPEEHKQMPDNLLATLEAALPPESEDETDPDTDTEEAAPDAAGELAEAAQEKEEKKAPSDDTEKKKPDEDTHKAGLRQADYTRKTQALAEERKSLHAEIAKEREEFSAKEEEFQEVVAWLESIKDPDTMEFELTRYYPEAVAALKDKWLLDSQEEAELTEKERAALRRAKDAELKLKA